MLASPQLAVAGAAPADGTMIPTRAEIENTKRLRRNELARLRYAAEAAAELELAGEYYNLEFVFSAMGKPACAFYPSPYYDLEYEAIFRQTFSIQFSPTGAEWGNAALFAP